MPATRKIHVTGEGDLGQTLREIDEAPVSKGTRNKYQTVYMCQSDHEMVDEIVAHFAGIGVKMSRAAAIRYCISVANEMTVPCDTFARAR